MNVEPSGQLPRSPASGSPVVELVRFCVLEPAAKGFEAVLEEATALLRDVPGYEGHAGGWCVETRLEFLLAISWSSLEDHVVGFRQSPLHDRWLALLAPLVRPAPWVRHYSTDSRMLKKGTRSAPS